MRNFFMYLICFFAIAYSKSELQESVESKYPKRLYSYGALLNDDVMHHTIVYGSSNFANGTSKRKYIAEYDSTVDRAYLTVLEVNCRDTIATAYTETVRVDANMDIIFPSLDNPEPKVESLHYRGGYINFSQHPLLAIPCGFGKYKKGRR